MVSPLTKTFGGAASGPVRFRHSFRAFCLWAMLPAEVSAAPPKVSVRAAKAARKEFDGNKAPLMAARQSAAALAFIKFSISIFNVQPPCAWQRRNEGISASSHWPGLHQPVPSASTAKAAPQPRLFRVEGQAPVFGEVQPRRVRSRRSSLADAAREACACRARGPCSSGMQPHKLGNAIGAAVLALLALLFLYLALNLWFLRAIGPRSGPSPLVACRSNLQNI